MTSFQTKAACLVAALSFSSCALESEKKKKKIAPTPEVVETPQPIEEPLPEEPVIQPLDFADPNTTGDLINAETTRTVTGPAAKKEETETNNNVIVVPPPLPTSELPAPSSN
jgi:hypothetical protein